MFFHAFELKSEICVQYKSLLFFLKNRRRCALNVWHAFMIDYDQHAMIPTEFISCVKLQFSASPDSILDFFRIVHRQVCFKRTKMLDVS